MPTVSARTLCGGNVEQNTRILSLPVSSPESREFLNRVPNTVAEHRVASSNVAVVNIGDNAEVTEITTKLELLQNYRRHANR
jgi:hypothetical protein